MKYLFAALALLLPASLLADTYADLDGYCRATNERFGAYIVEEFCSCLQTEMKKVITEEELAAYFKRPAGSPEDAATPQSSALRRSSNRFNASRRTP